MDDLRTITCPKCGNKAKEIIHAAENKRRGWYCESCKHYEIAILREKKVA